MGVSNQLHDPAALPRYPLDRNLGGPQRRYGRSGEKKSLPCPESNSGRPSP
jgi:hypothetical protein